MSQRRAAPRSPFMSLKTFIFKTPLCSPPAADAICGRDYIVEKHIVYGRSNFGILKSANAL
jgi:hypothetical protein